MAITPDADLDALTAEADGLIAERKNLLDKAEQCRQLLGRIATGTAGDTVLPCPAATRKRRTPMSLTNDLKHRLTVFNKQPFTNDIGESDYEYAPDGTIWGALTVVSGRTETLPGEAERAAVTHKLTIRPRSCRLTTATYFEYQGQRYDVQYWQPHYKRRDRLEVFLKLVIEDGA